jgi:outer membrane protein
MKHIVLPILLALGTAAPALAQSAGDWTLGFGLGYVEPKDNNGLLAGAQTSINANTRPTITAEYFIRDNLGVELLAALPFKHTVTIAGVGTATTKQLPPTVSLVYHFDNGAKFVPFAGIGLNYTAFFSEKSALGTVKIDDSFGVAVKAGFDMKVSANDALRAEVRWIDINSDVSLNGAKIGKVQVDPLVVGVSYVHKF